MRLQIHVPETKASLDVERVVRGLPVIRAPMYKRRLPRRNAKRFPNWHRSELVVETPHRERGFAPLMQIPLYGLHWHIEYFPVPQRATHLHVLGVRPGQRRRAARIASAAHRQQSYVDASRLRAMHGGR